MPDPISLKSFTDIGVNRQVGLGDDGQLKDTGSRKEFLGRLISVIGRNDTQRQENRGATERFVQAMKDSFGGQVGEWAQRELQSHLDQGKPLTGRRIQEIVERARTEHGGDLKEGALEYAKARKDDVMQGYIRNQAEGGKSPQLAEPIMFPPGWQEKFLERFELRLGQLRDDDATPPSREQVESARKQAFDELIVHTSHQVYHGDEQKDVVGIARGKFQDPPNVAPEVQARLKDFYENTFLPLEKDVGSFKRGDIPQLLDLSARIGELGGKFKALRDEMAKEGLPTQGLGDFTSKMQTLGNHLGETLLMNAQLKSSAKIDDNDLLQAFGSMGRLAREAQDPQKREEMFGGPKVRDDMARLDFELEKARIKRPANEKLTDTLNQLQGIVRQTAGMCSQVQGESKLTDGIPPYLKHAVVQYAPRKEEGNLTMDWKSLVGGGPEIQSGLDMLDKLETMVRAPNTPIQMRLDGAFHAQELRGEIEGQLGKKLDQGIQSQPFNTFLRSFTPAPEGEKLGRLNQVLSDVARARQVFDSGGNIPQDQREGLRQGLGELRQFLAPHMSGTDGPPVEARWLESMARALERRME